MKKMLLKIKIAMNLLSEKGPNLAKSKRLFADEIDFSVKLLTIADTHNKLSIKGAINNLPESSEYDLCILLGDISRGDIEILLKYIPKDKMMGILGNHDDKDNLLRYNIKNINKTLFNFNGINFIGLEGCIKYKENQPGYKQDEIRQVCRLMPKAHILISHNIPYGFMGELNEAHIGAKEINKYLLKKRVPLNICGHNHSDKQGKLKNGTIVIETNMIRLINISPKGIIVNKIETGIY